MAVVLRVLVCLLLPLIWGIGVELVFERWRRRRAMKMKAGSAWGGEVPR